MTIIHNWPEGHWHICPW